MTSWLTRNTRPILFVLVASAVVIAAFEVLDAVVASSPTGTPTGTDEAAVELEGVASLAGLIKVALFLALGAALTFGFRRLATRRTSP